jgi:hypothetical protein
VKITNIALDEESVISYFEDKTNGFGRNDNVRDGFDMFVEGWTEKVKVVLSATKEGRDPAEILYEQLKGQVNNAISTIDRKDWRGSAERAKRRVFRRFKPQDLKPVMGTLSVEELLKRLEDKRLLVIDMGGALTEAKLGFFLSLSRHLYSRMEAGEDLKMSLVIDEAPQYAPWEPKGIQRETTEMIKNLAALGRKRMLNLTLIAQGIKGEIGINAAVRRNLNTHFFGRIHPLDAGGEGGASDWLSPYGHNTRPNAPAETRKVLLLRRDEPLPSTLTNNLQTPGGRVKMAEELLEWVKLPQDLQHRFFELAEQEADKLTKTIQKLNLQLTELSEELQPHIYELPVSGKVVTVAAVDSSRSPRLSERLGVRCGVFSTGVIFLRGIKKRKEDFRAGVFKRKQALSPDKSRFLFNLLTTYAERKMALEALDHCDLLILDGSFYGFVYGASLMKRSGLYSEYEDRVLRDTFEVTEILRKSGKAIGIIKRSHTRAIGGYLALKDRNNPFTTIIDKLILSALMPKRTFFNYRKLIGNNLVPTYTRLATLASIGWSEGDLMEEAEKRTLMPFEILEIEKEGFKEMRRIQARFCRDMPPCEIDYPLSISEDKLSGMLGQKNFFNEATNLPIALDLVDNMVGLSAKFTEEFVSEVEGRVLEAIIKNRGSQEAVKSFFTLLNPQKRY